VDEFLRPIVEAGWLKEGLLSSDVNFAQVRRWAGVPESPVSTFTP
jgi:hypothetical protein